MRVGVVMVAFNRREFFRTAVESLRAATGDVQLTVVELDSCDGTADLARRYFGIGLVDRLIVGERAPTLYGSYLQGIDAYLEEHGEPEALYLTAEDYRFAPDWHERLTGWLYDAPPSVSHVTGDLEPDYPWNAVEGVLDAGGRRSLVRHTAPGANWAMTWRSWKRMEPAYRALVNDQHLDDKLNGWARRAGLNICALDLAQHLGNEPRLSAMRNEALAMGKPLDRAKWGM